MARFLSGALSRHVSRWSVRCCHCFHSEAPPRNWDRRLPQTRAPVPGRAALCVCVCVGRCGRVRARVRVHSSPHAFLCVWSARVTSHLCAHAWAGVRARARVRSRACAHPTHACIRMHVSMSVVVCQWSRTRGKGSVSLSPRSHLRRGKRCLGVEIFLHVALARKLELYHAGLLRAAPFFSASRPDSTLFSFCCVRVRACSCVHCVGWGCACVRAWVRSCVL